MKTILFTIILLFHLQPFAESHEDNIRYILIEAECKPGFDALPAYANKVILTKVWKEEFENAFEMVNAEPKLIEDFEIALKKEFPNQQNQVKDILVYMLNSEKEAKELYDRKKKLFKTLKTSIIELKVK